MISATNKTRLWRFGAIAFFAGLPLVMIGVIVSNMMDMSQADEATARKQATTATIVAQLEKHRAHAAKPTDPRTLYLASASDSLARAEIQALTTKLVTDAGGRLAQVQLTATPEQEAAGTVAIQLSLNIDNKGLLDLLYAVETGVPLLDVTDLNAQKVEHLNGEGAGDESLRVEMTIQGYWRRSAG